MKPHVLVVDDDPGVRQLLTTALAKEPYRLTVLGSAAEALALLDQETVDVIVSDEKMPIMSGTTFLARVRQRFPDTIRILFTGHATLESAIKAINEGEIYRFITKPCNMADLAVTIRQALEVRALKLENARLRQMVRSQARSLEALEKECPGITKVKRDSTGVVILDLDEQE